MMIGATSHTSPNVTPSISATSATDVLRQPRKHMAWYYIPERDEEGRIVSVKRSRAIVLGMRYDPHVRKVMVLVANTGNFDPSDRINLARLITMPELNATDILIYEPAINEENPVMTRSPLANLMSPYRIGEEPLSWRNYFIEKYAHGHEDQITADDFFNFVFDDRDQAIRVLEYVLRHHHIIRDYMVEITRKAYDYMDQNGGDPNAYLKFMIQHRDNASEVIRSADLLAVSSDGSPQNANAIAAEYNEAPEEEVHDDDLLSAFNQSTNEPTSE